MDHPASRPLLTVSRSTSPDSMRSDDDQPPAYDASVTTPNPSYTAQAAPVKTWGEKGEHVSGEEVVVAVESIGLQSDEVYERGIGQWRGEIRKMLVRNLVWESRIIAAMQVRDTSRTPVRD